MSASNTRLRMAVAAATLSWAGLGMAAQPSWNYAELNYVVDGYMPLVDGGERAYLEGFGLEGAAALGDFLFIRGATENWTGRQAVGPGTYIELQAQDWSHVGVGGHFPVTLAGTTTDFWAELSMDRVGFFGLSSDGFGYGLGARTAFNDRWETEVWYRSASTDLELDPAETVDLDPSAYGIDIRYRMNERVAVSIGRYWGEQEFQIVTDKETYDTMVTQVGLRYLFDGQGGEEGGTDVALLSYNQVGFGYLISGEASLDVDGLTEEVDEYGGWTVKGRVSPWDYVFIGAENVDVSYDLTDQGDPESFILDNRLTVGPGVYWPVLDGEVAASVYGQVSYDQMTAASSGVRTTGTGYRAGVRGGMAIVDVELFYHKSHTSKSLNGNSLRLKPEVLGIEVGLSPFGNGAAVTLGYQNQVTDLELEGTTSDLEIDSENWYLGLRQSF